jgi:addiction module RelE/StbE family toxin
MVIQWSPNALKKARRIYFFIEKESPQAAAKLIETIAQAVSRLADFPQMAAREPLLIGRTKTYRSLIVKKHFKIVYFVDETNDEVHIATVWDCRQSPQRLINELNNL